MESMARLTRRTRFQIVVLAAIVAGWYSLAVPFGLGILAVLGALAWIVLLDGDTWLIRWIEAGPDDCPCDSCRKDWADRDTREDDLDDDDSFGGGRSA